MNPLSTFQHSERLVAQFVEMFFPNFYFSRLLTVLYYFSILLPLCMMIFRCFRIQAFVSCFFFCISFIVCLSGIKLFFLLYFSPRASLATCLMCVFMFSYNSFMLSKLNPFILASSVLGYRSHILIGAYSVSVLFVYDSFFPLRLVYSFEIKSMEI